MLSVVLNLSIIVQSLVVFFVFFAIFQSFHFYRVNQTTKYSIYRFFFLAILLYIFSDWFIKLQAITNFKLINLFLLQNIHFFVALIATFIVLIFAFSNKSIVLKVITANAVLITVIVFFIWSKFQLFSFNPLVPIIYLVMFIKGLFSISIIVLAIVTYINARKEDAVNSIKERTTAFLILLIGAVFFSSVVFDYFSIMWGHLVVNFIVTLSIFLISFLQFSDFISIDHYKNPLNYFTKKIIYRLTMSLAIFIIISLECVYFGTIYIVRQEMIRVKTVEYRDLVQKENTKIDNYVKRYAIDFNNFFQSNKEQQSIYAKGAKLVNLFNTTSIYKNFYIFDLKGKSIIYIDPTRLELGYENKEDYYFQVILNDIKNNENYYSYSKQDNEIRIAIPIYNAENKLEFAFLAKLDANQLFEHILSKRFESSGEYRLYDKFMAPIIVKQKNIDFKEEMSQTEENFLNYLDNNNLLKVNIEVRQFTSEALAGLASAQYNALIFTGLSIFIFLIISIMFIRRIQKPLNILQDGAKVIGEGNLNYQIEMPNRDEFYTLAQAFNKMTRQIKENSERLKQAEAIMSINQVSVSLNHEINNPLATMTMSAQFILSTLKQVYNREKPLNEPLLKSIIETVTQMDIQGQRIKGILKNLESIQGGLELEDYVDGTKMIKLV